MKIGCLMKLLGDMENEVAIKTKWASQHGLKLIEIGSRNPDYFEKFYEAGKKYNLHIVALNFCFNFLINHEKERAGYIGDLKRTINIAKEIGTEVVVTATGRSPEVSMEENISLYREIFAPIVKFAEDQGIKLAFENSPFFGTYRGSSIGNIAISPVMWKKVFEALPSDNVGLTLDPSHLIWQFIDPYKAIKDFAQYIFHVHAKDTEILEDKLAISGTITNSDWWRSRLPGFGEINWRKFISLLIENGYRGVVSIEAIDPVWGSVADETFGKEGILLTRSYFQSIMIEK
jgi:sugar phosphate isomerase/epimerase